MIAMNHDMLGPRMCVNARMDDTETIKRYSQPLRLLGAAKMCQPSGPE